MKSYTKCLIAVALVWSGSTAVTSTMAAESIPVDKQITQIRTFTTFAQIDFDAPHPNVQGCSSRVADSRVAIDWKVKQDRKFMFATAMLAYATNKLVGFSINGCHPSGVPMATRVSVKD